MSDVNVASLIHKLQTFALGDDGDAMSDNQVAVATALLDRVLPDLHHIELTMPADSPISKKLLLVAHGCSRERGQRIFGPPAPLATKIVRASARTNARRSDPKTS